MSIIFFLSKRRIRFYLGGLGGLFLLGLIWSVLPLSSTTQSNLKISSILLDPGHGGVDGGARSASGLLEKEVNLQIALKIREQLRQSGLPTIMTRETDTDLSPFIPGRRGRHLRDLTARVEKARQNKSLFIVSIHCDWSTSRQQRGAVVFFNAQSSRGRMLALSVQEELNKAQKHPQKAAPGNYFILRQPGIEGILIEVGFLSHPEEAALLQDPSYQWELALAIAAGILRGLHPEATQTAREKENGAANDIRHN